VAALLELGAGFNPEFTGRENVYMNGAINGLTRTQIDDRFDDILDFAEIGEFIEQPVKTYSSGMFVRLAFAVAIHVDPEILLVDEALAVGDLIFQHRCINRIRKMRQEGKTILFVTHDLQALVRFCDKAILLDKGRKIGEGSPADVAHQYQALVFDRERKEAGAGEEWIQQEEDGTLPVVNTIPHIHDRFGAGGAEIQGVTLLSSEGAAVNDARAGEELRVLVSVLVKQDLASPIVGITIRDRLGAEVTATNSTYEGVALPALTKGTIVTVAFGIKMPEIRPGSYSISPAVASGNIWEHKVEDWIDNAYIFNLAETGLVYGLMKWSFDVAYRKSSS
jgi:ABC-type multidrug transport system ATPase subunit